MKERKEKGREWRKEEGKKKERNVTYRGTKIKILDFLSKTIQLRITMSLK